MLPWLFLEPDALCYLPVRATNSACVCVGRSLSNIKETSAEIMNQLLGSFVLPGPGPQQPPGGFGAAPGILGGQEDQGAERRHQVGASVFLDFQAHANRELTGTVCGALQSVHPVQRRQLSVLHRHILQQDGREGEAAGFGRGAGQTPGS